MISVTNRSHHVHTTKSTLFVVSKDEWDTKEGTAKSMKSIFYEWWYLKGHLWSEMASSSEKIKSISFAIRQAVSW